MTDEFDELRNEVHPDAPPLDREALRLVRSWHRDPAVHEAVWYQGVNLGEAVEFSLLPRIIRLLVERERGCDP